MLLGKIDRYIVDKFLRAFFFTVLIFTLITVIIDFSEKVEKFVEEDITRSEILLTYYPGFIVNIYGLLFPLFTLIAVIFFTSRLANNAEIISIFNAGVSFRRLMRPYWVGGGIIAILHFAGNHYFIPKGNEMRLDIEYKYITQVSDADQGKTQHVHMFLEPGTKVYVGSYRKRDSTIRDLRIEQYRNQELVSMLKASRASWKQDSGKWELNNYEIRTFDGLKEQITLGPGMTIDTLINLHPDDFTDLKEQQSMMTTAELYRFLQKQYARGAGNTVKYEAELHRRSAEPVTVLILTIIGLAVASRKVRGGVGLHLATGIFIGAIFLLLSRFAIVFAAGQALPVLLSIWLPNLIFGALALMLVARAQK